MGFFRKKKGGDILDLRLLQKRGIIKTEDIKHDDEIKELSNSVPAPSTEDASGLGGFFGAIASGSANPQGLENQESEKIDDSGIKNKVEDIEFKLDSMMRRLDKTLDRLDLAEKKINRLEGKGS